MTYLPICIAARTHHPCADDALGDHALGALVAWKSAERLHAAAQLIQDTALLTCIWNWAMLTLSAWSGTRDSPPTWAPEPDSPDHAGDLHCQPDGYIDKRHFNSVVSLALSPSLLSPLPFCARISGICMGAVMHAILPPLQSRLSNGHDLFAT